MTTYRFRAGSSSSPRGWFITGGRGFNTSRLNPINSTELFAEGVWKLGPELPVPLFRHCQVQVDDTVFVIGGDKSPGDVSHHVYSLDVSNLNNSTWKSLNKLKTGRADPACVYRDGLIYVIGGYIYVDDEDGGIKRKYFNSTEIYNLKTAAWTEGPFLSPTMSTDGLHAINYQGQIYLYGWQPPFVRTVVKLNNRNQWEEAYEIENSHSQYPAIFREHQIIPSTIICKPCGKLTKRNKKAGTELGQAQHKRGFDFTLIFCRFGSSRSDFIEFIC